MTGRGTATCAVVDRRWSTSVPKDFHIAAAAVPSDGQNVNLMVWWYPMVRARSEWCEIHLRECRLCGATAKATQEPCRRHADRGQHVCYMHGGASPQALAKARERIAIFVEPALEVLADLMDFGKSEHVRLRAARTLLEFSGSKLPPVPVHIPTELLDAEIARLEAELAELEWGETK